MQLHWWSTIECYSLPCPKRTIYIPFGWTSFLPCPTVGLKTVGLHILSLLHILYVRLERADAVSSSSYVEAVSIILSHNLALTNALVFSCTPNQELWQYSVCLHILLWQCTCLPMCVFKYCACYLPTYFTPKVSTTSDNYISHYSCFCKPGTNLLW